MTRTSLQITHEDVGAAVYRAIPPRKVSWKRRFFWRLVLRALRSPAMRRWMMRRFARDR